MPGLCLFVILFSFGGVVLLAHRFLPGVVSVRMVFADNAAGLADAAWLARGRRGVRAAGAMYRGILREIERNAYAASGRRAVVPRRRKMRLIVGPAAGAT